MTPLLWGDESYKQRSTAAQSILNAKVVTRSKTKSTIVTPRDVASPLARRTAQTLIEPSSAQPVPSPKANYPPIESARPIDDAAVSEFILQRQAIIRFVRDAVQAAVDKQKENADKNGRKNMNKFVKGDRVLISTDGLRDSAVTNLGASRPAPSFIGPFKVFKVIGDAYKLEIPTSLRLHPTFYVGRLKQYSPATLHRLAPMMGSEARKSASHTVLLDAPMTSGGAAFPSVNFNEPGVSGSSSV